MLIVFCSCSFGLQTFETLGPKEQRFPLDSHPREGKHWSSDVQQRKNLPPWPPPQLPPPTTATPRFWHYQTPCKTNQSWDNCQWWLAPQLEIGLISHTSYLLFKLDCASVTPKADLGGLWAPLFTPFPCGTLDKHLSGSHYFSSLCQDTQPSITCWGFRNLDF